MNINETGAPSVADDDFKARRGGLAQIDLTMLPGIPGGKLVADWRHKSATVNFASFKIRALERLRSPGMLASGDRMFNSRKDFLHYAETFPDQIQKEGIKFLSTFHRSLDAPSVIPDKGRPKTTSENLANGQDDLINPSLFKIKEPKGGLLIKRRFPLNRLTILEKGSDLGLIEKYFGFKKSAAARTWAYNHGDSTRILRLSEVSDLGREPDFFETLKAAIWVGSLGKILVNNASNYLASDPEYDIYHKFTDNQIMAIGLNIIDQWDLDSYPMRVIFDSNEIYGTENLPYLYQVVDQSLRIGGAGAGTVGLWFNPTLWNPHQSPSVRSVEGPTTIRFVGQGTGHFYIDGPGGAAVPVTSASKTLRDTDAGVSCNISINQYCQEPTALTKTNSTATGDDFPADGTYQVVGLSMGTVNALDLPGAGYSRFISYFDPRISFKLQYRIGNEWITYHQMENVERLGYGGGPPFTSEYTGGNIFRMRGDPRTSRFGHGIGLGGTDPFGPPMGKTLRPTKTDGSVVWDPVTQSTPYSRGWTFSGAWVWGSVSFCYGTLSENTLRSSTRYTDPDGVLRGADGLYVNGTSDEGYPQIAGNSESRPVILNRHFRSVGELGYAFRDLPWKHLDFFSEASADAALLDYFCIQESGSNAVVSAQIGLNTPYAEILAARLEGAFKKESVLSETISRSQAESIAKKIILELENDSGGPFQNRSELVTRFASKLDYQNNADNIIKTRREAAIRALANDSDTRTWNLMVDLVAQTGSYSKTAKKWADFDVKGQTRYWMHLAIDRYTGKILETKWEKITD